MTWSAAHWKGISKHKATIWILMKQQYSIPTNTIQEWLYEGQSMGGEGRVGSRNITRGWGCTVLTTIHMTIGDYWVGYTVSIFSSISIEQQDTRKSEADLQHIFHPLTYVLSSIFNHNSSIFWAVIFQRQTGGNSNRKFTNNTPGLML